MYDDNDSTYPDPLDDIEQLLEIRAHSPRFWDADNSELAAADPWEHPSWQVEADLADGWDDPAAAVEVLEHTVIEDARLSGLADTPTGRSWVRSAEDALADPYLTPEEELHERLLALTADDDIDVEREVQAA
ncbi:hypothetical protein [Nocardiopsis sp. FIRDI 009]|uniref:hypothetical protein n=1 Tax=Nocardiopsis sp. FIRDI 009 TaxID=714197 RepID=UPI000E26796F|nr:hypothetical protein [Nocardiopsis sp. FIRDI 009]